MRESYWRVAVWSGHKVGHAAVHGTTVHRYTVRCTWQQLNEQCTFIALRVDIPIFRIWRWNDDSGWTKVEP